MVRKSGTSEPPVPAAPRCKREQGFDTGLVEPNGAGKTTLIKCILNLAQADPGQIRVFGMDHRPERDVRSRIGFVNESSYLFEQLTAREIGLLAAASYDRWDQRTFAAYLERFELPERTKVKTFSRGMKMRLSLTIALSHEAERILMDEPSSGLDPIVRREFLEVIGEELATENRSFLISTHITSDLDRIADFVVIMDQERIRLTVSGDELADRYGLCRGGSVSRNLVIGAIGLGVASFSYAISRLIWRSREI